MPTRCLGSTIHIPWWEILGVPRVSMWVQATCTGWGVGGFSPPQSGLVRVHPRITFTIWFLIYFNILSTIYFRYLCFHLCVVCSFYLLYNYIKPLLPPRSEGGLLSKYNFGKLLEIIIQFFKNRYIWEFYLPLSTIRNIVFIRWKAVLSSGKESVKSTVTKWVRF